jgi:lipid II:glycine glycyltransferase (peptidoglycan interpeptide bridge formation enzyme)
VTDAVRELRGAQLDGWDAAAVDAAGGHVLQSRAWAAHREAGGWRPRFLACGEVRALALVRPWPGLGGGSAYLPRGPVGPRLPWTGDGSGTAIGVALVTVTSLLAAEGVDVIAADPEVADDDAGYRAALASAGYRPIEEIQPSRHRTALALPRDRDPEAVLAGVAKATRQRIRRAERDGVVVVRHDARAMPLDGFVAPVEPGEAALRRFYDLLRATGERRGFGLGGPGGFVGWWVRALAAGHLVYLEAREGGDGDAGPGDRGPGGNDDRDGNDDGRAGAVLGGLVLYRHGHRLSTVHSADVAHRRHEHPGTMHLLRWRAIQLAIAEGRTEMDLGGVDVAGARRPPEPGEATFGLLEHKRSFGAQWVGLAGAHETVRRPWRYAAGRGLARVTRLLGRGGGR